MQFLIATSLLVAGSSGVHACLGVHATGLYHAYGKREAQVLDSATGLVTYPNGAVAPFDPNVAIATANHYAAKAAHGYYPYVGAANVHPAAFVYGRKKREAQVPVSLVTGFAHTPYFGYFGHHIAPVVAPFTAHPNGALVPQEPADVVEARAAHLAAVAEAGRKKREAQVPVSLVTGFAHTPYFGYFGHHIAPVVAPFTAHPNGALVPQEPADVVEARAAHLAAVAEAGRKKREAQVPVSLVTGFAHTPYLGYFGHHLAVAPVVAPFTAHPNGALVPQEPADVVEARAAHLAAVAEAGRKKREAQVPVSLVTGFAHTPYLGYFGHHIAPVVAPFTAHPNGALVPQEPAAVVEARAAHLAAVAEAGK